MYEDIQQFSLLSVAGVVFGALNPDGSVDYDTTYSLAKYAASLDLEGEMTSLSMYGLYSTETLDQYASIVRSIWCPTYC